MVSKPVYDFTNDFKSLFVSQGFSCVVDRFASNLLLINWNYINYEQGAAPLPERRAKTASNSYFSGFIAFLCDKF